MSDLVIHWCNILFYLNMPPEEFDALAQEVLPRVTPFPRTEN